MSHSLARAGSPLPKPYFILFYWWEKEGMRLAHNAYAPSMAAHQRRTRHLGQLYCVASKYYAVHHISFSLALLSLVLRAFPIGIENMKTNNADNDD